MERIRLAVLAENEEPQSRPAIMAEKCAFYSEHNQNIILGHVRTEVCSNWYQGLLHKDVLDVSVVSPV